MWKDEVNGKRHSMEGNDSIMELEVPKEEAETSKLRRKKKD